MNSSEDVLVWPDGSWCYRYEREEMYFKSDDYFVIREGSEAYEGFIKKESGLDA